VAKIKANATLTYLQPTIENAGNINFVWSNNKNISITLENDDYRR
jgi:hypothetical protein